MAGPGAADAGAGKTGVIDVLLQALEELAAAGRADAACRLAGRACAVLRNKDAQGWQRFNALLHRLSKYVAENRGIARD